MRPERRNLIILFFTLIVVMLGFGMVIPIMPFYVKDFGAGGKELGALMSTFAIMQFIFAPFWGILSDRIGRKPVLMIGVVGNGIAMILFGLSTELWMLFASRILAGLLSSATLPTAMAYVGDSTSDEDRGGGMGLMGAAMGIGMVLGPGVGGVLGASNLSVPFFAAGGLSFVALLLILAFLPESLSLAARERLAAQGRRPSQFRLLWKAIFSPIGILLALAFLLSFGLTNFEAVFGLWSLDRFGYGTREVGIILTVIGMSAAIVQGALTGPVTKRWGEEPVIKVSFVGSAVGFILLVFSNSFAMILFAASFFIIFNSLLRPAIASLISKRSTSGQGVAMGLDNSAMSLGRIVGPVWAGVLYDANISYPYFSGSVIMLLGFAVSLLGLHGLKPADPPTEQTAKSPL